MRINGVSIADFYGRPCLAVAHDPRALHFMTRDEARYLFQYGDELFDAEIWEDVHVWSRTTLAVGFDGVTGL